MASATTPAAAELLTADDTYRHLDEAPPAGGSPDDPARMVGNGAVTAPNVRRVGTSTPGDLLALCSDGVHKHVGVGDLAPSRGGPSAAGLALRRARRARTQSHGSHDDATVLVFTVRTAARDI